MVPYEKAFFLFLDIISRITIFRRSRNKLSFPNPSFGLDKIKIDSLAFSGSHNTQRRETAMAHVHPNVDIYGDI